MPPMVLAAADLLLPEDRALLVRALELARVRSMAASHVPSRCGWVLPSVREQTANSGRSGRPCRCRATAPRERGRETSKLRCVSVSVPSACLVDRGDADPAVVRAVAVAAGTSATKRSVPSALSMSDWSAAVLVHRAVVVVLRERLGLRHAPSCRSGRSTGRSAWCRWCVGLVVVLRRRPTLPPSMANARRGVGVAVLVTVVGGDEAGAAVRSAIGRRRAPVGVLGQRERDQRELDAVGAPRTPLSSVVIAK